MPITQGWRKWQPRAAGRGEELLDSYERGTPPGSRITAPPFLPDARLSKQGGIKRTRRSAT